MLNSSTVHHHWVFKTQTKKRESSLHLLHHHSRGQLNIDDSECCCCQPGICGGAKPTSSPDCPRRLTLQLDSGSSTRWDLITASGNKSDSFPSALGSGAKERKAICQSQSSALCVRVCVGGRWRGVGTETIKAPTVRRQTGNSFAAVALGTQRHNPQASFDLTLALITQRLVCTAACYLHKQALCRRREEHLISSFFLFFS